MRERGFLRDPDAWGSGILLFGAPALKALSYLEHLDFLLSIKEEKFKLMFDAWESFGWWIAAAIGLIWAINRWSKRDAPHEKGPTWGLLASISLMTFIVGALFAARSSGGIPKVIVAQAIVGTAPNSWSGCSAQIDGSLIASFKKGYHVALICVVTDPQRDPLTDEKIFVSNLFEIIPGVISLSGVRSPSGNFTVTVTPLTVNFFAVLVPREAAWDKITTMSQLLREGGKILDPRYYN
jgi:hypothetical protein